MLQNLYTDTENKRDAAEELSYHDGKRGAIDRSITGIRGKQVLL
jgi:hypothetical protein